MPHDRERHDRNRRLTVIVGTVVVLGAILAAIIIYSGGGGTTAAATPPAPAHEVDQGVLVLGHPSVRPQVSVTEAVGSPQARAFEIASRDFLGRDAARGLVSVRYDVTGPAAALGAYHLVAQQQPDRLLCLHDALFTATTTDVVAAARRCGITGGGATDVGRSPHTGQLKVSIDGRRLTGDPVTVAERLETMLAANATSKGHR